MNSFSFSAKRLANKTFSGPQRDLRLLFFFLSSSSLSKQSVPIWSENQYRDFTAAGCDCDFFQEFPCHHHFFAVKKSENIVSNDTSIQSIYGQHTTNKTFLYKQKKVFVMSLHWLQQFGPAHSCTNSPTPLRVKILPFYMKTLI